MFVSPSVRATVSASVTKSTHRTKLGQCFGRFACNADDRCSKTGSVCHIALNLVSVLAVSRALLTIRDPETPRNDHFGHYDSVLAVSRAMLMISVPKRGQVGTSEYIS